MPGRPVLSHSADAVDADGLLFVAGILPADADGALVGGDDVVAQAECVFDDMGRILDAGGCAFADVVKVTVYLTDVDERPLVNPVRERVFGAARPASTLVEVSGLAVPGARIEVDAVAAVP
jgi:2-iminobutanoate/2-iminopropanoate deaminase